MNSSVETDRIEDEILYIVKLHKNHLSIAAVKNKNFNNQFSFRAILKSEIKKEILNFDVSKTSQDSDIPTKIIIGNADILSNILLKEFDRSLEMNKFPLRMKL